MLIVMSLTHANRPHIVHVFVYKTLLCVNLVPIFSTICAIQVKVL